MPVIVTPWHLSANLAGQRFNCVKYVIISKFSTENADLHETIYSLSTCVDKIG
jgi:hypothetical protein